MRSAALAWTSGIVIAGAFAGVLIARLRPQPTRLGPQAEVQLFEAIHGICEAVSSDGRHASISVDWERPSISFDGGDPVELPAIPEANRVYVSLITNDGVVYGGYDQKGQVRSSFRWELGGELEKHWPNAPGIRDLFVLDATADLATFVGPMPEKGKNQIVVWRNGKATRLPWPDGAQNIWSNSISDDGRTCVGSFQKNFQVIGAVWTDGVLTSTTAKESRSPVQSANGRFRVESEGPDLFLRESKRSQSVWHFDPLPPPPDEHKVDKNGRPVWTLPGMQEIEPCFVSNDGALIMATTITGQHGEINKALVWQDGKWSSLGRELETRGATLPKGWQLAKIFKVSENGQTLTACATKGPMAEDISPVIIRFHR